jgi:hypothetical protein
VKFEFIHGDTMLYLTAETEKDKDLFRTLAIGDAQILGSNIETKDQPEKWLAITFHKHHRVVGISPDEC